MKISLSVYLIILLFVSVASAQQYHKLPKKVYNTKPLLSVMPPELDGILDDEAWSIVEWTTDYIENLPDENTAPVEQTKFKIVYDRQFIYFGFKCYDKSPKDIVRRLSRRDGFEGDWIEINIDSHNDQLTAFSFSASVAGVKSDGFISDNGKTWEGNWNPIWYVKTLIDDEGWTAEIKIPLSQLKFSDSPNQVWGLQSTRRYFRTEERSVWQRIPRDAPGWVSEFGEIHGLVDLAPKRQIELKPFLFSKIESYPEQVGNPFKDGRDLKFNGGLDAKIGVTNDLTLNLTINPDFGQVEADPAAIALDGFQIFNQEQRPFFVENKNIFDYNFADDQDNLFYSRRIGRSPNGSVQASDGAFVSMPDNTAILGAAKFGGKTKSGWSIGILESVTDKEFAKIDESGNRRKQLVEPLTNYAVGRVQKDFNNSNSYIGGILTSVNRDVEVERLEYLHRSAYSAGLNFMHNWKNRKYYIKGNFIASHVEGSKESIAATQRSITHLFQRSDSNHLNFDVNRTSLTGTGGKFEIGKASTGNWTYNTSVILRSPELELNDIGFLRQANEIRQNAVVSYQTLKPLSQFRQIQATIDQFTTYDFDGNFNKMELHFGSEFTFKNNWHANINLEYLPVNYSNSALQGGPRFRFSEEVSESVGFTSDNRKKLKFSGSIEYTNANDNSFNEKGINIGVIYQPTNALTISLSPDYSEFKNSLQYIGHNSFNAADRYLVASITQQTLSAAIRLNYNLKPDLTIQYYGQPFISTGRYKSLSKITDPTAAYYTNRISVFDENQISFNPSQNSYSIDEDSNGTSDYTINNPDFSFVQFRSNLVLRWEYIAGSELYLVWSQGIVSKGNPNEDLISGFDTNILQRKPSNIFLVKLTYRFIK
jgi:hypothetical protein